MRGVWTCVADAGRRFRGGSPRFPTDMSVVPRVCLGDGVPERGREAGAIKDAVAKAGTKVSASEMDLDRANVKRSGKRPATKCIDDGQDTGCLRNASVDANDPVDGSGAEWLVASEQGTEKDVET